MTELVTTPLTDRDAYKHADIEGHIPAVKKMVKAYVNSVKGESVEDQRANLPFIKKHELNNCVTYVMENLPAHVTRVDGYCVKSILIEVVDKMIKDLPPAPEPPEEA